MLRGSIIDFLEVVVLLLDYQRSEVNLPLHNLNIIFLHNRDPMLHSTSCLHAKEHK